MNKYHIFDNQQGLSLLEILLAIALASIGMTILVSLSNTAITGSGDARSRSVADQYVRQDLDLARSYRDINGFTALSSYANSCHTINLTSGSPAISATSMSFGTPVSKTSSLQIGSTAYYHIICFAPVSLGEMKVTATVGYNFKSDGTVARSSSATTILSSWK